MSLRNMPETVRESAEYWQLVNRLMQEGWYRAGPGPELDRDRETWGFRKGHVTDPAHRARDVNLWISAASETEAMSILLQQIHEL